MTAVDMSETARLTIASDAPGRRLFMLGNEAIARGAIEAGVEVVAAYPGTPSSEINEALISVAAELGYYAEWSINEKVAFEIALGASLCGKRAMTMMKHVGLNVAQDALLSAAYMGTVGGLVVVNADDPGQWSSQTEQDNRYIAELGYIPVLEPSSPQEAKDMTADAFRLSEEYGQMFMVRTVTRISHARGDVTLGEMFKEKREGSFKKDPRFICMPATSRVNRGRMIERMARIRTAADGFPYNRPRSVKGAKLGVIACGISYGYAKEALRLLGVEDEVSLLKIGTPHPLPEKMVQGLLASVPEVLVIEELEPFVENHVKIIAQESGILVKIHGKDLLPLRLELSTRKACEAIAKLVGCPLPAEFAEIDELGKETAPLPPFRPPTLCSGCSHRASFYALNAATKKLRSELGERISTGDIGCYSLASNAPLNSDDVAVCMGGGFGVANGIAHGVDTPVIGHLGDSTFFHSGIAPMINAVFNKTKITMLVLDNSATAMTGFQPHPGTGVNAMGDVSSQIRPEDLARACGVKFVEVVDPYDVEKTIDTIQRAIKFDGPALVVTRRVCSILDLKERKGRGERAVPYYIDREECNDCQACIKLLACPAILCEDGRVSIDASQCPGCGVCAWICPKEAIKQELEAAR